MIRELAPWRNLSGCRVETRLDPRPARRSTTLRVFSENPFTKFLFPHFHIFTTQTLEIS